ncbi:MAG: NADH-quinone oxidoreductase subunit N [Planctomycetota bacterium]|nr:NADH-quinone oxidoreductase subunit N [Planctomycetota bacterium]
MSDRLAFLWPEIALFAATCVVMVMGLSRSASVRGWVAPFCGLALVIAGALAATTTPAGPDVTAEQGQVLLPNLPAFAKLLIAAVGVILLMAAGGTVDRREEAQIAAGKRSFDPLRTNRAEFYAFFLFSITGLMLCASADDLIWLFLALELTSLPTYIMVAISTARNRSREAGVKYFFLGALGAAIFLYGFALIYGGTQSTNLNDIREAIQANGVSAITLAGFFLAFIGLSFKIAAVPMHFYVADVYQGAAPGVSAFLAFVPKTAGFLAMLLLAACLGWEYAASDTGLAAALDPIRATELGTSLPEPIRLLLWVIAALTMTVGNVLALMQNSVKRVLAYSSVAHSGYMLVGVIVGPGDGRFASSGVAAVLFYLVAYGVMNVGAFAVLSSLERRGAASDASGRSQSGSDEDEAAGDEPREIDHIDDLRGMWKTRPGHAIMLCLSVLGLLGFPPLLGFLGKYPLFTAGISAGEISLVIILGLNSAISAVYYLRLVAVPFLSDPDARAEPIHDVPIFSRVAAGVLSAGGVVAVAILANPIMSDSERAAWTRAQALTPPTQGESAPLRPGELPTMPSVNVDDAESDETPPVAHAGAR